MITKRLNTKHFIIIWLLNPFLSFLLLIKNSKYNKSIFPFLLISFFFGMSFVIDYESGADSVRYSNQLLELNKSKVSWVNFSKQFYLEGSYTVDLYQPILTWIVSRFTGDYKWLFGIYSIIFGYFWFKSILISRQLLPEGLSIFLLLLILLFSLINPIWNINGVRMWTAIGMFFFGLLLLNFYKRKIGYLFIILPVFVHFSLVFALCVYVGFKFLPSKNLLALYVFYLVSFFFVEVDVNIFSSYYEFLPDFLQSRKGYLSEEYASKITKSQEVLSIHIKIFNVISTYFMLFVTSWIFINVFSKRHEIDSKFLMFYKIALFFSVFSNLIIHIPSGGRFMVLSNLLLLFSFIWYNSEVINGYLPKNLQKFLILVILYLIIIKIRIGSDYFGYYLFFGNPLLSLIIEDNVPFIIFIKTIF